MNIVDISKAAVDVMNGKKMNTGTIVVMIALALKVFGVSDTEATSLATSLMLGFGAVLTAWGYIHRWIKEHEER